MDKERFFNKTVAIFILSVLLALVIGVAIGFGISHEGRGERGEKGGHFSQMNFSKDNGQMNAGYYDDHNQNPNDAEVQDDQATTTASTTVTVQVQKTK